MKTSRYSNVSATAVGSPREGIISAIQKQLEWLVTRTTWNLFDAIHRVDTGIAASEADLEYPTGGIAYSPAAWNTVPYTLRLASLPVKGVTFVDVGCGKGKVLLSARRYPFSRIDGVEYLPHLTRVAERNLGSARFLRRRCDDVRVTCGDAVEYRIPEGPVIFFFANPFTDDLMIRVLSNVVDSYVVSPRLIFLIFFGASSRLPRVTEFFGQQCAGRVRLRASGAVGKRSLYVFEMSALSPA